MIGHAPVEERSAVTWAGNTLMIDTKFPAPPGDDGGVRSTGVRYRLSLDPAGALIVETTRGTAPATTTYRRKS